jgi:hypothetical protein
MKHFTAFFRETVSGKQLPATFKGNNKAEAVARSRKFLFLHCQRTQIYLSPFYKVREQVA